MASVEERLKKLEMQMISAMAVTAAIQGQPASATISIPHNDSWLFEDNLDSTHPGNLRYVISSNVQRVVSARLSIHLAPYRTYNSLTLSGTGPGSNHLHSVGGETGHSHSHAHTLAFAAGPSGTAVTVLAGGPMAAAGGATNDTATVQGNGVGSSGHNHGNSGGEASHTHSVSGTAVLGVTEGATAAGVAVSFDGVDQTAILGGPFSTDQIELNVLPYLPLSQGVFHVIAMQPSGLGRIEAHLRLGVYVAAGSVF